MKELLSAQITPVIPLRGSISASGGKHIPTYNIQSLIYSFSSFRFITAILHCRCLRQVISIFNIHSRITACFSRQPVHPTLSRRQSIGHPPNLPISRSLASLRYRTYHPSCQRTFRIGKRHCCFCRRWGSCHT
jgi:hypothetical protein